MQRQAVTKEPRNDFERFPDETTDEAIERKEQRMKDKSNENCCGPEKHTLPPFKTGRKGQDR